MVPLQPCCENEFLEDLFEDLVVLEDLFEDPG
jgi:hypothetical protein